MFETTTHHMQPRRNVSLNYLNIKPACLCFVSIARPLAPITYIRVYERGQAVARFCGLVTRKVVTNSWPICCQLN